MANVVSVAGLVSSNLVLPAFGSIIGVVAFQFLQYVYQEGSVNNILLEIC